MINLNIHYARALLDYGEKLGMLEEFYRQAAKLLEKNCQFMPDEISEELIDFFRNVPAKSKCAVLRRFVRMAHERLNLLDVRIVSAAPLTGRQLSLLTERLAGMFQKRPVVSTTVDALLLGGVRVVAGNILIDDSLRKKLSDLKQALYREVLSGYGR